MTKKIVITIDGPAGSGKTTVSRIVAGRLGYRYVDTGALYRGVAYESLKIGVATDDEEGLSKLCNEMSLEFVAGESGLKLISSGVDISDEIRSPEISMVASKVSKCSSVRAYLLKVQKEMGLAKGAVFEGRDMGTVVFPDAELKFFLTASLEKRAARRFVELSEKGDVSAGSVAEDMKKRDDSDTTRKLAPLKKAEDALEIDSSDLTIEEVVLVVMEKSCRNHIVECLFHNQNFNLLTTYQQTNLSP